MTSEYRIRMLVEWEVKFRFKYYHRKHYVINITYQAQQCHNIEDQGEAGQSMEKDMINISHEVV